MVLLRGLRMLGISLVHAEAVPVRLPEVVLQRMLLPRGGIAHEVHRRYQRALLQQAWQLVPSSALLGDPYGLARQLVNAARQLGQEMRRASWADLPAVTAAGASRLVQGVLADGLRAAKMSALAISKGLTALLQVRSEMP